MPCTGSANGFLHGPHMKRRLRMMSRTSALRIGSSRTTAQHLSYTLHDRVAQRGHISMGPRFSTNKSTPPRGLLRCFRNESSGSKCCAAKMSLGKSSLLNFGLDTQRLRDLDLPSLLEPNHFGPTRAVTLGQQSPEKNLRSFTHERFEQRSFTSELSPVSLA